MKKHLQSGLLIACLTFVVVIAQAQVPGSFNYQAIARNAAGVPLVSKNITIRVNILEDSANGYIAYTEIDSAVTTAQGYFTIQVGNGVAVVRHFNDIDWGNGKTKWLKISIDPLGGSSYKLVGASQLLSVPYALFADKTHSGLKGIAPLGITANGGIRINPGTNVGDLISWDGVNWVTRAKLPDTSITTTNIQPYLTLNWCIALQGIFPSRNGAQPFLAELELFGFNFAPQGWAQCDGQLLPISQNTALFSLLGTYYGGNGVNTFALPDLRGRVPINQGQGPGLSPYNVGQVGGTESNTIIIHR